MKTLFLLIGILTVTNLSFAQGRRNNNYDGRITINYGNGDSREYVEARFCGGGPTPAPASRLCILERNGSGFLTSISNAAGQTLPELPNEDSISKLQRAVSTGFCSLGQADFCSKTETAGESLSDSCSPQQFMTTTFYVNNVGIVNSTAPVRCTYSDGDVKKYGNPSHNQDVTRYTSILKSLCPNNNL